MSQYAPGTKQKTLTKNMQNRGLVIGAIVGLVVLIFSILAVQEVRLTGLQATLFHAVNEGPNALHTLGHWITKLGSAFMLAGCVLVALLLKRIRLAVWLVLNVAVAFGATFIIKRIVDAPRPQLLLDGHLQQRAVEFDPSFPSGHVTIAAALAITFWFVLPVRWRWICGLWIAAVAWSRLYLGVHTPIDVLGGFAVALTSVSLLRLLSLHYKNKRKTVEKSLVL